MDGGKLVFTNHLHPYFKNYHKTITMNCPVCGKFMQTTNGPWGLDNIKHLANCKNKEVYNQK